MKQMRLSNFCKEYGIPRQTVIDWVYTSNFPAYKLNNTRWYVDVAKAIKWIEFHKET